MTAALFSTSPVVVVDRWTGRYATALRLALRATNESFARRIGTSVRAVVNWNANPALIPTPELQQALDSVLGQAPVDAQHRFLLLAEPTGRQGSLFAIEAAG